MAAAELDMVIRQTARQQGKLLAAAIKARRDHFNALAAKAKDAPTRDRYKQIAKDVMEQGSAAARRLQMSADNAADSYARSMRMAADAFAAKADASTTKTAAASAEKPPAGNAPRPVKKPTAAKKAAKPKASKAKAKKKKS